MKITPSASRAMVTIKYLRYKDDNDLHRKGDGDNDTTVTSVMKRLLLSCPIYYSTRVPAKASSCVCLATTLRGRLHSGCFGDFPRVRPVISRLDAIAQKGTEGGNFRQDSMKLGKRGRWHRSHRSQPCPDGHQKKATEVLHPGESLISLPSYGHGPRSRTLPAQESSWGTKARK